MSVGWWWNDTDGGNRKRRRTCRTADLLKDIVTSKQLCDITAPLGCYFFQRVPSKGRYTLSVKPSDFTVWRHTWRKNWVNCAVFKAIAQASELSFPVVFHTENSSVHSENLTVSSVYLPAPQWYHLKAQPFLAIHSADEHRMIYSFSNTTSYSTFYAFFSSFRITLWPMWLANSKRQPCFYPPQSHAQEDTQNWPKKNWQTWWETGAAPENISSVFRAHFFTQLNCTV